MINDKTIKLKRVVVTGLGLITSLGHDVNTVWERILLGESGIDKMSNFKDQERLERFCQNYHVPKDFPLIAGEVKDFDLNELMRLRKKDFSKEDLKQIRYIDKFAQYAVAASLEAVNNSNLDLKAEDAERIGVIIASGMGGVESWEEGYQKFLQGGVKKISPFMVPRLLPNLAAGGVSIIFNLRGPNFSLSNACAAGGQAIGAAFRCIQMGEADIVFSGGAEAAITPLTVTGFYRMGALATGFNEQPTKASRPFDKDRSGFVMAEGAGMIILEELHHALSRNAKIYAEVVGFGMSGNGNHITDPDLDGTIYCIKKSLQDANVLPEWIDYINPHATSTVVGDFNESRAIQSIFLNNTDKPLISATKSMTGHLLGAAGAVDAILTIKSLEESIVPQTINLKTIDKDCLGLNYIVDKPVEAPLRYALSNSFGFGGTNVSLVLKKYT
jgi:3-oxoacyl-[acyl-carrier-protein] synthase II